MPQSSKKNIALTGFMAVGKSVVGRRLARRLKRSFVDLDRAIEEAEGMKVGEIFKRKGEAYFRRAEKEMLGVILRQGGQVIATGGGVVMDGENLELLKDQSFLVCLKALPETIHKRSGSGKDRPLLAGGDRQERIEDLLKRRAQRYAQAHVSIDTEGLSVAEVVEKIVEELGKLSGLSCEA